MIADVKPVANLTEQQLDCIREAVKTTFSSIYGEDINYLGDNVEGTTSKKGGGVVGIISFIGDLAWSLMLGLPEETAMALASKFAGFEIDFESEDMGDVVGELANIVAGDLVARLDAIGAKVNMSLPTIARGRDFELLLPDKLPSLRVGFTASEGEFWIKLAVGEPKR